ncbi:MAG: hypothetical protein NTX25_17515, partial [Proteobacteria bacterium]|nr:hypothetical protein [Pseudomonadota bacterium]
MGKRTQHFFAALIGASTATQAFASGAGATFISYYGMILGALGMHEHQAEEWKPVVGAVFTLILSLVIGFSYRSLL